jgi:Flp pilus assembly CpaE family ATPase
MKTLLVDLNFSEGGSDAGYYLNIPKSPNMIVFTEGYSRIAMDNAIIKIAENFDLLQPPPTYELAKKMDLQDIYSLIDIAKRKYHLIIFDLPNLINEMYLGVLDIADLVIMISDNTLGSIGRLISINNRFIYEDLEKILVINRTRNGNGLTYTKNQLRQFFNLKELIFLEEDNFLNGRTDFSNFNFDILKNFGDLSNKVLDLLTYD